MFVAICFNWTVKVVLLIAVIATCVRFKLRRRVVPRLLQWNCKAPSATTDPSRELLFFMHGWPDDARIWDHFVDHFAKHHVCITYTMPGFSNDADGFCWGYDFDCMVDSVALTISDALEKHTKQRCVLMIHDWGAVLGELLQRKYPDLVERMFIADVAVQAWDRANHLSMSVSMLLAGLSYQWWLATAFLVSSFPVAGPPLGNAMTRAMASCMRAPLCKSPPDRQRTRASMNYFYFYFHAYFWPELFCLMPDYDRRNSIRCSSIRRVPTLFIYSSPFFHSESFRTELREHVDCEVVALDRTVNTHWFIYESPHESIRLVEHWLQTGKTRALDKTSLPPPSYF
eukprot:TRINITY_DN44690_c0_g1_i1.p1 TRINITY_DN44690_c0_g1~~TRINITY_DN44690_c0_g1_i1.p1  ORF type:complete len:360 (-),score=47.08 TRINITY_DN44690_c0_g1_i1:52-1077(-)